MLITGSENKLQDIIILWRTPTLLAKDGASKRAAKLSKLELMYMTMRAGVYAEPILMGRELADFQDFVLRAVEHKVRHY